MGRGVTSPLVVERFSVNSFLQRPISLNLLVEHACVWLRREIDRAVEIRLNLDPCVPMIGGDEKDILYVLQAVCRHAARAVNEQAHETSEYHPLITLRTHQIKASREWVGCEITDNGAGISPELRPYLFEPALVGESDSGQATLPEAYLLMEKMGGAIDVESDLGLGTFFYLKWPMANGADSCSARKKEERSQRLNW